MLLILLNNLKCKAYRLLYTKLRVDSKMPKAKKKPTKTAGYTWGGASTHTPKRKTKKKRKTS